VESDDIAGMKRGSFDLDLFLYVMSAIAEPRSDYSCLYCCSLDIFLLVCFMFSPWLKQGETRRAYGAVVLIAVLACCSPRWARQVKAAGLRILRRGGEHVEACGCVHVRVGEDMRANAQASLNPWQARELRLRKATGVMSESESSRDACAMSESETFRNVNARVARCGTV
jgi:hypothetical protein